MNRTLELHSSTFLRIVVIVSAISVIGSVATCTVRKRPSTVIESLVRKIEVGEIDQASAYMSQGFVSRQGIDTIKNSLRQTALWIRHEGGIKSFKVLKEDTVGDVAEVTIQVTRGSGDSSVIHYKLIWEQRDWKVDAVGSEPTSPGPASSPS